MTKWWSPEALEIAASAGVADPVEAVRQKARSLLHEHGEATLPVRLSALFPWAGIRKVRSETMPLEGALRRLADGRFDILVRDDAAPSRQRFSIAHELGHVLFYRYAPRAKALQIQRGGQASEEEERLCNIAAEELLMPGLATDDARNLSDGAASVLCLAQTCDVSVEAAMIRLSRCWPKRGELQLWSIRGNKWNPSMVLRLRGTRTSLESFEVQEWNNKRAPENLNLPWRGTTSHFSVKKRAWLFARTSVESVSRRVPTMLVCHEFIKEPPKRPTDLENAARERTRRAQVARPLRDCAVCGGSGWMRSDLGAFDQASRLKPVPICPCRFDQNKADVVGAP